MSRTRHSPDGLAVAVLFAFTGLLVAALFHGCSTNENADAGQRANSPAGAAVKPLTPEWAEQLDVDDPASLELHVWPDEYDYPLTPRDIRVQADTWDELVTKTGPMFTWGTPSPKGAPDAGFPDMMWIDQGPDGRPVFRLARAYLWTLGEGAERKKRWVLLDFLPGNRSLYGEQVAWRELPVRLDVTDEPDTEGAEEDGFPYLSYARHLASHPRGGTVYEIGWAHARGLGNAVWKTRRFVYVWQDQAGSWRLIGDGPEDFAGRFNGIPSLYIELSCKASVQWKGDPARPVVSVVEETRNSDGITGQHNLVTFRTATLDTATDTMPAKLEWSSSEHTQAEENDTLETVVRRLAFWNRLRENVDAPEWEPYESEDGPSPELVNQRAEILKTYETYLRQLNPHLPADKTEKLPEGTRINIR